MENVAIKGRGGNDVQHKNWKGKILRIWIIKDTKDMDYNNSSRRFRPKPPWRIIVIHILEIWKKIEIFFFSCILTSHFNCTYFPLYTARATRMSPRDFAFWAKSFRRQLWNYVRTTTATFASQLIYTASLMTVPDAVTRAAQSLLFSFFVEK